MGRVLGLRCNGIALVVSELLCLAPVLLVLAAPAAHAAGKEAKERAARKACLSGDYAKGVGLLSDLFIDTEDPNYIFNQARCFEQNSRWEDAIGRFREYLRKATKIGPADRADTEKHISDCQALLDKKEGRSAGTAPTSPTITVAVPKPESGPTPAKPAPPAETPQPALAAAEPPGQVQRTSSTASVAAEATAIASASQAQTSPGRGLRIAGITCGAVGLASVGTAIYFYTRARSYSDKVQNELVVVSSDEQAGKSAQTMQWVFYSVGGAALATGVVLYVLGARAGSASQVAAAPMFGPGLAGLSAQGAF
jgi:hypothetical protein